MNRRVAVVGGSLAIGVSAVLLIVVLVRDVGLNPLNGWTIVLGTVGGALALRTPPKTALSVLLLVLAMPPALIGGMGLLYVLPIALIAMGRRGTAVSQRKP